MEGNLTVNIHYLRSCNYHCKFCFHRGIENSSTLKLEEWHKIIDTIAKSGLVKRINFAGGEPFMLRKHIVDLIRYAKKSGVEVSVITNASLLTENVFNLVKNDLDMLGVSCDSGNDEINKQIGRAERDNDEQLPHTVIVRRAANMAKFSNKYFKVNTVICRENLHDNSIFQLINEIQPNRWKVFRVLKIENENGCFKDERPPYTGYITDEEWKAWIERCKELCQIKPVLEDNDDMQTSYIQVDEEGYLLDSSSGSKVRKANLLEVSFKQAMTGLGFDQKKFYKRGGLFHITNANYEL